MTMMHEWLASQSGWWWPRIGDHLWQTTLFALLVFAATLALRQGPARVRHVLWMLASLKLLVPATLLVFLAERAGISFLWMMSSAPQIAGDPSLVQGISEPVLMISNNYHLTVSSIRPLTHNELYCLLSAVWLVGSLSLLTVWGTRRRRFLQALKLGRRVTAGREWETFNRAKALLGLTTPVDLVLSQHKTEPIVARIWRPVVMLPESIGEHLNDSELEAIMLHELVHVQRHDNLIGNLQMSVVTLLWFHPLVWYVSRRLISEREQACDERVLAIVGAPETYASSILKVVRFSFGWKVAGVSGAGNGSNLRRRIKNIMSSNNTKRSAGWARLFAGMLMGLALVLMVVAGVNTRARNLGVERNQVGNDNVAAVYESAVDPAGQRTRSRKPQPPLPPQPNQPDQPAQPPQSSQPAPPSQPSQAPQPTQPSQPSPSLAQVPPTPASAPNPASPPSQPSPAVPQAQFAPKAVPILSIPPTPAAAPTAPIQSEPKRQKKDRQGKGNLIEAPHPEYPVAARRDNVSGTVTVEIEIDEDGNVASAKAASGPDVLRAAAVKAAYRARFKPAMVNGKPVKFSAALTYDFVIDNCNGPRCSEL
jgi:TonB family protein